MKRLPVQTPAMARKFLLGVVALTALAWPAEVVAQGVKATVLSIGDGDTIRVRQAGKALTVRLACIDAPESAQAPYGPESGAGHQPLPPGCGVCGSSTAAGPESSAVGLTPTHTPVLSRALRSRKPSTVSTRVVMSAVRSMPMRRSQRRVRERSTVASGRSVTS